MEDNTVLQYVWNSTLPSQEITEEPQGNRSFGTSGHIWEDKIKMGIKN
jgi:hypothetical protein